MAILRRDQAEAAPPWRAWSALAAFSALLFLITASTFSALGVVLPAMVKDEAWSWTEAGLGFTLLGACCGASSFIPAYLIRRYGVRAVLMLGTGVMALGFLCLSATRGLSLYLLGTALCGVGYQMMALIPGTHVLAAAFKRRALAFGLYFTFGSLGGVAGPLFVLGVMQITHEHWRVFWTAQIVIAVLVGALCTLLAGSSRWLETASSKTDAEIAAAPLSRVHRSSGSWTLKEALQTPQFYVLLAAYFGHLLCGVTVASLSPAHLTERGVAPAVAGGMLSFESLMGIVGRLIGGLIGDHVDPRHVLVFALASMVLGMLALSVADGYPMMILYAAGTGLGFGLAALAVTVLLLNYFGREHNLEIFSATCLIGAVSALGPVIGGVVRDYAGGFGLAFQLYAGVIAVILAAGSRAPIPGQGGGLNVVQQHGARGQEGLWRVLARGQRRLDNLQDRAGSGRALAAEPGGRHGGGRGRARLRHVHGQVAGLRRRDQPLGRLHGEPDDDGRHSGGHESREGVGHRPCDSAQPGRDRPDDHHP
jgi:MFS family permease